VFTGISNVIIALAELYVSMFRHRKLYPFYCRYYIWNFRTFSMFYEHVVLSHVQRYFYRYLTVIPLWKFWRFQPSAQTSRPLA